MEFKDKLQDNFRLFECKLVDESVLTKFVEICKDFEVDEDGIVESWVEFVNGDENESSTDITTEKVEAFESWFKKNIDKRCAKPDLPSDSGTESTAEELSNLDKSIKNKGSEILERSILNVSTIKTEEDDDILEMYGRKKNPSKILSYYEDCEMFVRDHWLQAIGHSWKRSKYFFFPLFNINVPDAISQLPVAGVASLPRGSATPTLRVLFLLDLIFIPAQVLLIFDFEQIQYETSFADPEVHEDKENDDEDIDASTIQSRSGEIVLKFGFALSDWNNVSPHKSKVQRTDFPHASPIEAHLFVQMKDYSVLNDLCRLMSRVFCEIWLKDKEQLVITSNVREKTFNKFRTWGRIITDNDGKLTTTSILLMGDPDHWYHSLGEYETEDYEDNEVDDNIEIVESEESDEEDSDEEKERRGEVKVKEEREEEEEGGGGKETGLKEEDEDEENEKKKETEEEKESLGDPVIIDIRTRKECIPLDVSRLKCYSFFPGQIISVEGKNPTKDTLCAYRVIPGISFGPKPPVLNEPLHIMVAAGPFTSKPGNYQQLYNLMAHVAQTEPNVLILIGPLMTEKDIVPPKKDMFENLITKIMSYVDGKSTQVVLVSSYEDVLHDGFYPTPEYRLRESVKKPNLHLMPDPCTIEVDGLIIGITSVDIIRHLSSEEISYKMPQRDRLGRLAEHLLLQSSYYPLFPPAPEVPLDLLLWAECSTMNVHPHILLVPSAMQYFYKYSNGTHIINPSKVSKGLYTQFNVRSNDQWTENSIGGEILRI
ncbi:Similar to POLA2: DNA polymerase alpha subunit B (Homo sapiens) [Cotesia congregata]|uniref:DNA polymerase alpha subunit B n=1 Tax=Cotesia congregata TaxID=51543 RepID=A0A8J2HNW4_COTCN|nr:Similar to POLA2: DNA polymerase alpha subunit B (Homo sapiens) [Cotesia congregata]